MSVVYSSSVIFFGEPEKLKSISSALNNGERIQDDKAWYDDFDESEIESGKLSFTISEGLEPSEPVKKYAESHGVTYAMLVTADNDFYKINDPLSHLFANFYLDIMEEYKGILPDSEFFNEEHEVVSFCNEKYGETHSFEEWMEIMDDEGFAELKCIENI